MVSESSIQIVMFASPVSLLMVFVMVWSICMRVERRRWPQTQTSSLPVMFQSVSLLPQALPASLSLSVSVTEPQMLPEPTKSVVVVWRNGNMLVNRRSLQGFC